MEKPNVNEKEQTMGFHIGTTIVLDISKWTYRQLLGQVTDIEYVT